MPSQPDLHQQKQAMRAALRAARSVSFVKYPDAPQRMRDQFLANIIIAPGAVVSGYIAQGDEMDPRPLMEVLHAGGHALALPIVGKKHDPLSFRVYRPADVLTPRGAKKILEPAHEGEIVEPDVILAPLVGFDRNGQRLGQSGGYYDRTLIHLRARKTIIAVGLAYACQEVPRIPTGPNDAKLDKVITEIQAFSV